MTKKRHQEALFRMNNKDNAHFKFMRPFTRNFVA